MLCLLGAGGCGDDGGGGAPDAELGPVFCETSSDGCSCNREAVDELSECGPDSVAREGAIGFCCEDGSDCACHEVLCREGVTGCACGSSFLVAEGDQVESCTGKNCCRSADGKHCLCSLASCTDEQSAVESCSMGSVTTCADTETPAATCL